MGAMSDIDDASASQHPVEHFARHFDTTFARMQGGPLTQWLRRKMRDERPWSLLGWSVVIGLASGLIIGSFRNILDVIGTRLQHIYSYIDKDHLWILLLVIAGCLLLSLLLAWIVKTEPLISGSGIPDVEKRLRSDHPTYWHWWKVTWRKIIGGIAAIGPGLFLGREGPSVQIGASIGLGCSGMTTHSEENRHALVSCGAAAGLSAAFTAPLAAVIFIAEEVYSRFTAKVFLCSFVASVSATLATILVLGDKPGFELPAPGPLNLSMWWQFVLVGIGLGFVAYLYEKTLFWGIDFYTILHIPQKLRAFVPLMLMIPLGMYIPEILGGGATFVNHISRSNVALWLLVVMFLIRLAGSQLSYGSGVPGGVFLPILSLGAVFGLICGKTFALLHCAPASLGYYSVVESACMAGLFGATVQCPLTAIILVTEMTGYSTMVPMSIVTLCACVIYDLLGGKPVYDELGVYVPHTSWKRNPDGPDSMPSPRTQVMANGSVSSAQALGPKSVADADAAVQAAKAAKTASTFAAAHTVEEPDPEPENSADDKQQDEPTDSDEPRD